jgi:hypothetical protein
LALERLTLDARSQPMQLLAPAAVDFTTGMSLDDGACDIFMSLLVIAPETTLSFTLTQPVLNGVPARLPQLGRHRRAKGASHWRRQRARAAVDLRRRLARQRPQCPHRR